MHSKFWILALGLCALSACETMDALQSDFFDTPLQAPMQRKAEAFLSDGCPRVQIVNDLGEIYDFGETPNSRRASDLMSQARIAQTGRSCAYNGQSVTVDTALSFQSALGPKARSSDTPFINYPYFVAVAEPGGRIMGKEVFGAALNFGPGQTHKTHQENLRQIIPLPSRAQGAGYRIMVGFQLTPEQLSYNRWLGEQRAKLAAKQKKSAPAVMQNNGGTAGLSPAADGTQAPVTPVNGAPVPLFKN